MPVEECKFGHAGNGDGSRYCHVHCDFVGPWHENQHRCPTAIQQAARPAAEEKSDG